MCTRGPRYHRLWECASAASLLGRPGRHCVKGSNALGQALRNLRYDGGPALSWDKSVVSHEIDGGLQADDLPVHTTAVWPTSPSPYQGWTLLSKRVHARDAAPQGHRQLRLALQASQKGVWGELFRFVQNSLRRSKGVNCALSASVWNQGTKAGNTTWTTDICRRCTEMHQSNSIAFGKSTSQRIYRKQCTHKIG